MPVCLFATIGAIDIVRDADLLPLMKRAGIRSMLGHIVPTRSGGRICAGASATVSASGGRRRRRS